MKTVLWLLIAIAAVALLASMTGCGFHFGKLGGDW